MEQENSWKSDGTFLVRSDYDAQSQEPERSSATSTATAAIPSIKISTYIFAAESPTPTVSVYHEEDFEKSLETVSNIKVSHARTHTHL